MDKDLSMTAPVFGTSSDMPVELVDQINLDEIFEDCFAQDWQFFGGDQALDFGIPLPPQLTPPVQQQPAKKSLEEIQESLVESKSKLTRNLRQNTRKVQENNGFDDDDDDDLRGGNKKKRHRTTKNKRQAPTKDASDDEEDLNLTDQQRLERRERNREHAKRSRIRKKFLLESLLEQVSDLRSENKVLRHIIRERVPDEAHQILNECSTEESLLLSGEEPFGPAQQLMEPDFRLMMALQSAQQNFAVSDPSLPDNPIVYASKGFLNLTGYAMNQVIGRNCRFLQGPGTDAKAVDVIRQGVTKGIDTSVCLLNYKADGTVCSCSFSFFDFPPSLALLEPVLRGRLTGRRRTDRQLRRRTMPGQPSAHRRDQGKSQDHGPHRPLRTMARVDIMASILIII